jgi:hypothetical protein
MISPTDYLLTPRDVIKLARRGWRRLTLRHFVGLVVGIAAGLAVWLWLGDASAGVFAMLLAMALVWRVDSRVPLGLALGLLVLIPLAQLAYQHNWAITADDWSQGLAVWVFYFLAIGVVSQVVALARQPAVVPERESEPFRVRPIRLSEPAPKPEPALAPVPRRTIRLPKPAFEPVAHHMMDAVTRAAKTARTTRVGRPATPVPSRYARMQARRGQEPPAEFGHRPARLDGIRKRRPLV